MKTSTIVFPASKFRSNLANFKIKVAVASTALLLAFSAQSADKNYDNLHKQLTIMNDIMLSSAKATQNSRQSLIRSIDSVYLQGQGAIFTIKSNHRGSSHRQFFQTVAPLEPLAPLESLAALEVLAPVSGGESVIISNNEDLVVDFGEIDFEAHEDELERVIEVFEQQREGARELRSEQREIAYELRDIDRERKDIEYQLQRAENKTKNELTAELKKLEVNRNALNKNKIKLEQKVTKLNKQREEQKIAQSKARKEHFSTLNNALVETLCLYGNGLRAVPSNEYVSFIIKGAGKQEDRGFKDQILVFNKKDINACANSKLTAKKLLAAAEQYQF
jgi:flagellar motility protein MotE (MotC chaperone)